MPATTVEIHVADVEPVRKVLAAAGDLYQAAEAAIEKLDDGEVKRDLGEAAAAFKATALAQGTDAA